MSFSPAVSGFSPEQSGYTTPLLPPGRAATPGQGLPPSPFSSIRARVLDSKKRHRLALERHNFRDRSLYLADIYHTLVNCPWYRFYLLFVLAYMAMYCFYAAWYWSQPGCLSHSDTYLHALWFSVHTSAAIGYGDQAPDPDCRFLQAGIICQVLTSLLFQASLLGVVFSRISNSSGRSASIRFSKALSMYRGEDGLYRLAFRVGNLRLHQVLQPEVRMLLLRRQQAHPFSSSDDTLEYVYSEMNAQHIGGGQLWLGVPSIIEHRVDERSPLFGMTEEDVAQADLEIIVLLDGIDESTSKTIEARHSYVPADIRWQHHFDPVIQRRRSGKLGVDFSLFDGTHPRVPSGPASVAGDHENA